MLTAFVLLACSPPEAPRSADRWPRPGDSAIIEVNAAVDGEGHATAWGARAWAEAPEVVAARPWGCRRDDARVSAGNLAAVDLSVPSRTRLGPTGGGALATQGPLVARDARWQLGDAALTMVDGERLAFGGAVRFGDAPDIASVRTAENGDVTLRVNRRADETIEVETVDPTGAPVRCSGPAGADIVLPWTVLDPAHPVVTVRSVRETVVVAPNEAILRVRAAIEASLSVAEPMVTERAYPRPRLTRPTWEPKKATRFRPNWG